MNRHHYAALRNMLRTATLFAMTLAAGAATEAGAGEQAQRAIAGVRQLMAIGGIPPGATLQLGFKQGNIDSFLGPGLELQREWERETGTRIHVHVIEQQPTLRTLQGERRFDLTVARNHELPELLANGLIEDLSPLFAVFGFDLDDNPRDGYIRPVLQSCAGDRIVAVPADGDVALLYLRRDLLEDAAEQASFRKRFGRDLSVPETWHEYEQLVDHFHRPEEGMYGAAEERGPEWSWMYWLPRFLSQSVPHQPLFDTEMRALLDSPAGIAATEHYLALMPYSPPGITAPGQHYNFTMPLFAQGRAFATIVTIAGARVFNSSMSAVRDRFMVAPLPGNRIGDRIVRANTVIYGNNLVLPRGGQTELAFHYAMWLTDPDISARSIGVPGGFADPYRWNHLSDSRIREIYTAEALEVFANEWAVAWSPGTGLPGDDEYLSALDRYLSAAARGEVDAREAMARAQAEWESITERRGRTAQIESRRIFEKPCEVKP